MFFANNFLFSFAIIAVSFTMGWLLYSYLVLGRINLREALFEKDNVAAWVEFIGAFVGPTLFLAASAIQGSASSNIFVDLLVCLSYVIGYVAVFTFLRMASGFIVRFLTDTTGNEIVILNDEIFKQHNVAAALFSTALSVIFANMVRFMDVQAQYIMESILVVLNIFIFSLLSLVFYVLLLRRKTSLVRELFIDNNIAEGICFLGFVFGMESLLGGIVSVQTEFHLNEQAMVFLACMFLYGFLNFLFRRVFTAALKIDLWNEVYEQNNIGAAIGIAAIYIGVSGIILHFIK